MRKLLSIALLFALADGAPVLATPSFGQNTAAVLANPLGGNISASGATCATVSACVWMKLPAGTTTVTVTVTSAGGFTGTLQFEQSSDSGNTFVSSSVASVTVVGVNTLTVTSFTDFRVRASALSAGIASVNIQASGSLINITTGTTHGVGAPSGPCSPGSLYTNDSSGALYSCNATVWAAAGGGGSSAFSALTGSTNTTAAMVVGTGASLTVSGSGTNNATSVNGNTYPANAGFTSGGVLCATSTTVATTSGAFVANGVLVGGGVGVCPSTVAPPTGVTGGTYVATSTGATPIWSIQGIPVTAAQTGVYTFNGFGVAGTGASADQGSLILANPSAARIYTIPAAGGTGFNNNSYWDLYNENASFAVTLTPTTSTINGNSTALVPPLYDALIYSDNSNYFAAIMPTIGAFPNCTDSGGNHINFTSATGIFTCGTTSSGGGTPTFPITVAGTVTSGGIPYFNSTTQESSSALLALDAVVIGGGAGGAPATLASLGNSGAPLLSAGAATPPAFGALNLAGGSNVVTGTLPAANVASIPLNQVISPTGAISTFADGNNPLIFNCALTSGTTCMTTGETTAATTAGAVERQITTLTTSTAIGLQFTQGANGPANAAAPNILNVSAAAAGGLAGASNAGSAGAAIGLLTGAGSAGGATTGNGGGGGAFTITEGAGGNAGGTATNNGGNGGGLSWTTGAGGNGGSGAGTAGSGGNITFTLGAPGTNSATGTIGSIGLFTLTGNAPASTANATGVASGTLLTVLGVAGGASSNAAGTAGVGSIVNVNSGIGGAGTGTNAVGGAGGNINVTAGNGGASAGTGVNANGGNIVITPGAAGTGGSGTAGKAGVLQVAGPNAGFVGYQQGAANTLLNTQIPANTAVFQAPAAVTAYFANVPGAAPTNNFSAWLFSNANPSVGTFAKMPQTVMLTTQYTNSTTSFSNVTGTNSLAFAVEASTTYQGYCTLYYQAASTGGLNIEFTGPASPTFITYSLVDPGSNTTLVTAAVATAFSTSLGAAVTTAATNFPATVTFGFSNGVNAGTLQMLAKSSAAAQLQIQTGSYCVMQ